MAYPLDVFGAYERGKSGVCIHRVLYIPIHQHSSDLRVKGATFRAGLTNIALWALDLGMPYAPTIKGHDQKKPL
jgi:hypothetical protein